MKEIRFTDVSMVEDIDHLIPWNAQLLYSVHVGYGDPYCTSVVVILIPDTDPVGWDSFESDLASAVRHAVRELYWFEEWDWT